MVYGACYGIQNTRQNKITTLFQHTPSSANNMMVKAYRPLTVLTRLTMASIWFLNSSRALGLVQKLSSCPEMPDQLVYCGGCV